MDYSEFYLRLHINKRHPMCSHTDRLLLVVLSFDHKHLLTRDGDGVNEVLQNNCGQKRHVRPGQPEQLR